LKLDKTEIKFQLYEGREKQTLLERYLHEDSELSYLQGFINPYTGENIESKRLGSLRESSHDLVFRKFSNEIDENSTNYNSKEDIGNLSKLIKNRIKNLETASSANPLRTNHAIKDIKTLPEQARRVMNKEAKKLADDYFKQVYLGTNETTDLERLPGNAVKAKLEIDSLADLIHTRRPKTSEEEGLVLLDQLFEIRKSAEEFRIKDEIARLQILLSNEEANLKYSEAGASSGFINELRNQIIQLSREAY
jgi:hypothetical protein